MIKSITLRLAALFTIGLLSMSLQAQTPLRTIPAPQKWQASKGSLSLKNVSLVNKSPKHSALLEQLFTQLESELAAIGPITVSESGGTAISFEMSDNEDLGSEGYQMTIAQDIKISANSYAGLLYGSRTMLQMLQRSRKGNSLYKGVVTDYPEYEKRMLMIDVARKFIPLHELKDYIRSMAWLKMNELQIHFNDNSWGGYSAYRLESAAYPELTAKDGHYSWEEIRQLQDFAAVYGVVITPEIDSPGHSAAFTKVRPDLQSPLLGEKYLDILNPETITFMETILSEVIPHFDAPDFHIGTDEYRLNKVKDPALKEQLGEQFRQYITYFNAYVRGKGKNCRIWSGYEHMPGTTEPALNTIIDMWETSDAPVKSEAGYQFINSSHHYTYIVPGAPYYGVNDKFVYDSWTPERFSKRMQDNLQKGDAGLMGSKLHIWNDMGPTGYSTSEIARLSVPSMVAFAEKMWGTKGYKTYNSFSQLRSQLYIAPLTNFLSRDLEEHKRVYKFDKPINLVERGNMKLRKMSEENELEYPWTLSFEATRTQRNNELEVLLSSENATIYTNMEKSIETAGSTKEIVKKGITIVRARQTKGDLPRTSHRPDFLVFDYQLPIGKTTEIKIVGEKGKTTLYADGKKVDSYDIQSVCPIEQLGSDKEANFKGIIRELEIVNYVK